MRYLKHATIVVFGFFLWFGSSSITATPFVDAATAAPAAATSSAALQGQIDAYNQQINALNQQIADYQSKLQQIGADKKTLQAAIKALDLRRSKVQTQVAVTQRQIGATQLQIQQLGGQIVDTEQAIVDDQAALGAYLRSLQVADHKPLIIELLRANEISQVWIEANATVQIEDGIRGKMDTLQSQRNDLANTQTATREKQATLAAQQQSLTAQQQSLAVTVASKNQLLADTKAQESNYQKLLAAAEAQLESFSAFAQNAGGSKLLGSQTVCDSWGCYYNQRDTAWGSNSLNGTRYTLASDGCLVTSMAMMMTHYGYRDVTPVTINSNPDNFAVYYPAYLLTTISVDGVSVTRKTATIDATLSTGNPVVVGVRAYGGTHFVVLVSGRHGNYLMRDPYIANGKDISFSDHYAVRNIFGVTKVVIGS